MTLQGWLDSRTEAAPPALRARIATLVDGHAEWERMPVTLAMLEASGLLMADVLASPAQDRRTALDLLAADACVTYAFEAAAESPDGLGSLAEQSMRQIARLLEGAPPR